MHTCGFGDLSSQLEALRDIDMYRSRRQVASRQGRELTIDGRLLLNFCSNDYLGLAGDPRLAEAFKSGVDRWGTGAGASHLICGHTEAHHALEESLAAFTGRERALLYSSGYAANVGVINALLTVGDQVFEDRLNHASLLDGGWISRADFHWYRHNDTHDLADRLTTVDGVRQRVLVVSDGTFSMDGDQCELEGLVELCAAQSSWLMVDDAHGMGVHGKDGTGTVDPARFTSADVPILIGTLGKAFGTAGAFVAGDEVLIETLIQRSRNYIYTTAIPAAIACATSRSLEIVKNEQWRRDHLKSLIRRFRNGASHLPFELMPSESPIQPLVVGDPASTLAVSRHLEAVGCLCTAIRPPTVPEGTSRLRITFTAAHTESDVDRLLEALRGAVAHNVSVSK